MTLDEAIAVVSKRYGFLRSYVTADGKMLHVVAAESELKAIPGVSSQNTELRSLHPRL